MYRVSSFSLMFNVSVPQCEPGYCQGFPNYCPFIFSEDPQVPPPHRSFHKWHNLKDQQKQQKYLYFLTTKNIHLSSLFTYLHIYLAIVMQKIF